MCKLQNGTLEINRGAGNGVRLILGEGRKVYHEKEMKERGKKKIFVVKKSFWGSNTMYM